MTTIGLTITTNSKLSYGSGPSLDPDAQAFITATGITNAVQVNAINQLVIDLKLDNLWDKCIAIYPYIGGTATTHKYNLKNPLDTDAAFRILWVGGVTHNANGITGNGTNGYGETYIKPSTHLTLNSTHIAFWSKTNSTQASSLAEMGITDGALNASLRICSRNSSNYSIYSVNDNSGGIVTGTTDSTGFWVATRTASNLRKLYRNGVSISSNSTGSIALSNATIPVLAQKAFNNTVSSGSYSIKNFIFASAGQGLTDSEVANYNNIVNTFQTAIGR
jgi:hypothetical protein